MRLQIGLSNGSSTSGDCYFQIDGPGISDAQALNLAESILDSDYVSAMFTQGGTPTVTYVTQIDMTRTVPVPA